MTDEREPAGVVTAMLDAIDNLDWAGVRAAFADTVETDYTTIFGGEPETIAADDLVERWQAFLPGFDATQHLTGPILVTPLGDEESRCVTTVRGYHHLTEGGGATWMVAARYDMRLRREGGTWKITVLTATMYYEEGTRALIERAGRNATSRTGRRAAAG